MVSSTMLLECCSNISFAMLLQCSEIICKVKGLIHNFIRILCERYFWNVITVVKKYISCNNVLTYVNRMLFLEHSCDVLKTAQSSRGLIHNVIIMLKECYFWNVTSMF